MIDPMDVRELVKGGLDRKPLVIIGAGGYAKSVIDSIDHNVYKIIGFIDEKNKNPMHLGYPIISDRFDDIKGSELCCYFVAIGNNKVRKKWYEGLLRKGLECVSIVDRSAIVSSAASIGHGCFVGKMAIINSKAQVGDNVIVNTKALIEHGCHVESHANLSTNSCINGDVHVEEGAFVGSCSVTLGQKTVGAWSTIGAGAVVTHDVAPGDVVAGVPARVLNA